AGDGAGILTQIPDGFFRRACHAIDLPAPEEYAVGMLFLPPDPGARAACEEAFTAIVRAEGGVVLGWRTVPVEERCLGTTAREGMPAIRQVFIGCAAKTDDASFLRMLYAIRKEAERVIRYSGRVPGGERFYVASLSPRTIVYKGLLTAAQVPEFYRDLVDPSFASAIALVHSRFSTNTFPSWERAHPYRYLVHNGEINTLRANINWMRARDAAFAEASFAGMEIKKILPILAPDGSDSAMCDNCLEFLLMTGRSLPEAIMMMIPEPWEKAAGFMSEEKRAFYEYHSYLLEPWDGPAAMAFTDGVVVGAVLDRNGLRPARYWVTEDDLVILASEAGVIPCPPGKIRRKGRLQAGRLLLVDTVAGRIVADEEIKERIARTHSYRTWLGEGRLYLSDLPPARPAALAQAEVRRYQKAFGYTDEDLRLILAPMAQDGVEPVGSMGYDAPLAVLSERPQLLYDYFKQLFAQVTNPPIDAIREEIVTSTEVALGPFGDLLAHGPEVCRQIRLSRPILTDEELARLKAAKALGFEVAVLPILFPAKGEEEKNLKEALEDLFRRADTAIAAGARILILSDRGVDRDRAAIPALLAAAGLHHHLIRQGTRLKVGLVLESGEPREVHHFALLFGYGAGAINPYLAFATLAQMIREGLLGDLSYDQAVANYVKAATKGILKVASKMGISTLRGYQGAQVFEAVGIDRALIERYFTGTPSRIGGIGLAEIAREARLRHAAAFSAGGEGPLPSGGHYQWRRDGEEHLFNPETVHKLQRACRTGDYGLYREYAAAVNDREKPCTLRQLLAFRSVLPPVPLAEVEPVEAICRRFKTGAMSFGSISREAHEARAIAMNRLGGKSNTGEGGEDPARFVPLSNGDSLCSAIKQVASGRFGVTSEYLVHAEEIQIKIAQGAKPGEGGQLPGGKVYPWIARVRHSIPGVGLISPPPHHDIYSIEDLAELIYDLKNANPQARINVKLVAAAGVGTIAVGVAKAGADVILI
ncbi:MAG: glutamate synthase large subunit, partial [Firmicutes bacterium]|nr:glutamate synthase large subunit [Bacillota bacterium]